MRRRLLALFAVVCCMAALTAGQVAAAPGDAPAGAPEARADGFAFIKTIDQAVCQTTYSGGFAATHYERGDCVRIDFSVTNPGADPDITVEFSATQDGPAFAEAPAFASGAMWRVVEPTGEDWPSDKVFLRVMVAGQDTPAGGTYFFHNALGIDVLVEPKAGGGEYAPGDAIDLTGTVHELASTPTGAPEKRPVAGSFKLRLRGSDGTVVGPFPEDGTITAEPDGSFAYTIPAGATDGFEGTPETGFATTVAIEAVDATYDDPSTGEWSAERAGASSLTLFTPPDVLLIENSFVSSTGWVKPGDTYPFRIMVRNFTETDATNVTVTVPAPDGAVFNDAVALSGAGTPAVTDGGESLSWTIPSVPKAAGGKPTVRTLVVEGRADSLADDPQIVWKDISSTATVTYNGYAGPALESISHGPKVIPPNGGHETARYGDKPFPMVPVDYTDNKHQADNTGDALSTIVNDPETIESTFNLYQEMSFGQLFPKGTVPSAGIASAGFDYDPGFEFTRRDPQGDCRGTTFGELPQETYGATPLYPERIVNGWYQLPGDTEYYGGDFPAFDLGTASNKDGACGQSGKAVYDGAAIADPEIDYNEYDSDKDGVVDFFMLVFVGCGGNGASQLAPAGSCPYDTVPYDNIWPHSSSLEMQYKDEETGLRGFISDDQLKSLEEIPQCWLNDDRVQFEDCAADGGDGDDDLPVYVRVGPYNVNPENAIDSASVISHEYGHHLGLPDFYNSGEEIYADLNLMAADYAQHMTIFSKQDMGWVVPEFIEPGTTLPVEDWREIKEDTGQIRWETPDGTPYTLSGDNGDQNIHNGEAYGFKLPVRQLIDPVKVREQTAQPGSQLWYSGRGNDFGCSPNGGHNLDIFLPELSDLDPAEDVPITVSLKSSWDIEWDWDYGFVLTSPDGQNYLSHPSEQGYTTDATYNPNGQTCLTETNNGLTGQSGSYEKGEPAPTQARNPADTTYNDGSPFLLDSYDISDLAGAEKPILRFSYFTDAAFDRPGWFIDDIEVKAGDEVIYSSNFEGEEESGRVFPGGCDPDGISVAVQCTDPWTLVRADEGSTLDHAYYLELRDQALFDFNGYGQSDRGDTSWDPGAFIEYTDETHGYGNSGVPWPPAQHYLDSKPQPGLDCVAESEGNCADASFTGAEGDNHFDDTVDEDQPEGWVDNFEDPSNTENVEKYDDENWHFDYDCLSLDVTDIQGEGTGPDPGELGTPADLRADAVLRAGEGCRPMQYYSMDFNEAPTALAQAKPRKGEVGQRFRFDGGRSYDDLTALDDLTFAWDVDGDGFDDGDSQTMTHRYATAGTKTARLRVKDAQARRSIDGVTVEVTAAEDGKDKDKDKGKDKDEDDENQGGNVGNDDKSRDRDDRADRGGPRTPPAGGVGDLGAGRDAGGVANTGSAALLQLAAALLALTAGAWLLLRARGRQPGR